MNAGEIQVLKDLVDVELKKIIDAEVARLPAAWAPMAMVLVDALVPAMIKALDDKIGALVPTP